jgi:hypothetical protein
VAFGFAVIMGTLARELVRVRVLTSALLLACGSDDLELVTCERQYPAGWTERAYTLIL